MKATCFTIPPSLTHHTSPGELLVHSAGLSFSSLKTTNPESCPAAIKLFVGCTARLQKRSPSFLCTKIALFFCRSQTRKVLSSASEISQSLVGWKATQETLLVCPLNVSSSQALESLYLQSLTSLSSEQEAIKGFVGWKVTQLTPRSCPSRTCLTTTSNGLQ